MGNFTFVNKAPNIIEKKHQTLTNFSFFLPQKANASQKTANLYNQRPTTDSKPQPTPLRSSLNSSI